VSGMNPGITMSWIHQGGIFFLFLLVGTVSGMNPGSGSISQQISTLGSQLSTLGSQLTQLQEQIEVLRQENVEDKQRIVHLEHVTEEFERRVSQLESVCGSTEVETVEEDPQCLKPYSTLQDTWREERHGEGNRGVHCDSGSGRYYTGFHSGWYRFAFPNNPYATIPTSAPPTHHQQAFNVCGTRGSSWTNSTLPELGDKATNITIFFAWQGNNWNHPQTGQVVPCTDTETGHLFMIYYLPEPTGGCDGYCAA